MNPNRDLLTSIGYKVASIEEIANFSPAAFSPHRSPNVTDRYSCVSSVELLEALNTLGWTPNYTRQNGSALTPATWSASQTLTLGSWTSNLIK